MSEDIIRIGGVEYELDKTYGSRYSISDTPSGTIPQTGSSDGWLWASLKPKKVYTEGYYRLKETSEGSRELIYWFPQAQVDAYGSEMDRYEEVTVEKKR